MDMAHSGFTTLSPPPLPRCSPPEGGRQLAVTKVKAGDKTAAATGTPSDARQESTFVHALMAYDCSAKTSQMAGISPDDIMSVVPGLLDLGYRGGYCVGSADLISELHQ